jgi:hypothetical protein
MNTTMVYTGRLHTKRKLHTHQLVAEAAEVAVAVMSEGVEKDEVAEAPNPSRVRIHLKTPHHSQNQC